MLVPEFPAHDRRRSQRLVAPLCESTKTPTYGVFDAFRNTHFPIRVLSKTFLFDQSRHFSNK